MPQTSTLPQVKISPRGAMRLKSRHVWVYRSDIVSADGVLPGSLVRVTDHRGKPLGTALYSSSSQIAIRMIVERDCSRDRRKRIIGCLVTDLPGAAPPANRRRHRLSRAL